MTQTANQSNLDAIEAVVSRAVGPLVERLSKMETKIDSFDARFYTRELTDGKFKSITDELESIRQDMKDQGERFLRYVGAAAALLAILAWVIQHVRLTP